VANLLDPPDEKLRGALNGPEVVAWATRVRVPAVISSERETRGVTLVGVDPEREAEISFVAEDMAEGRFLESPVDAGLIVGRRLVNKLETGLGKRVVIMSQSPDNEIADRGFRIVGIFESKMALYEEGFVFAGEATVQRLLGIGERISEVAVLGSNYRDVEELYRSIEAAVPEEVEVRPWYELDRYLGAMLGTMDGFVWVWIVVVFLALSFGLVNTLVMAVFERVREIGLMLALGMTPRNILSQIVVESVLLLSLGLAVGNLAAWGTIKPLEGGIDLSVVGEGMEWFGASSVLYPALYSSDLLLVNLVVLVLGFLASLSPAWRASRFEPVEAITKV